MDEDYIQEKESDEITRLGKLSKRDPGLPYCDEQYGYSFLEAGDIGDATSLKQKLSRATAEERHQLINDVDQQGCTGLLLATKSGDLGVAEVLLEAGANPLAADMHGVTGLHYAARRGDVSLLKLLLACRTDTEKKDDEGETTLMYAQGGAAVDILLEAGADAHAGGRRGKTALMFASSRGDLEAIRRLARAPGIELNAQDNNGITAHAAALAAGYQQASELLVDLGAVAAPAAPPRLLLPIEALHEAVRTNDGDTCLSLLKRGDIDINAVVDGETALLLALTARPPSQRVAGFLLDARADPNFADPFLHETPLLRAVRHGSSSELVWQLLEAKADPSRADLGGNTPGDVAASWGNQASAEILRAAAAGVDLGFGGLD